MSRFFIDRPIFAWVIAIIIMVVGAISIKELPIAQYPPIAPPAISVAAFFRLAMYLPYFVWGPWHKKRVLEGVRVEPVPEESETVARGP